MKTPGPNLLPVAPERAAFGFTVPDRANSSAVFIQIGNPWQARTHLTELPRWSARANPPPSHPKGKQNGFTAPAAGHLSRPPSAWWSWRTRNTELTVSGREVLHRQRCRTNCVLHTNASFPELPQLTESGEPDSPHSSHSTEIGYRVA